MEISIGRSTDNDIIINNDTVSRHHAKLRIDDTENILLEDLSSTHGTYLNERRIVTSNLVETDHLVIGKHEVSSKELLEIIEKLFHKSNNYKKDFKKILEEFYLYEKEKNQINKNKKGLIMKSSISIVVIGILSFIPNINASMRIISISVITPIIFYFFEDSPDKKLHYLDELKAKYEDKLVCPKCKMPLIHSSTAYWKTKNACTNMKCKAIWK